jgi:drug/metabolite transporter (DMT)-like permease
VAFLLGFLGVVGFSVTLPVTRVAVEELDPTFVGLGRAVVAACLAACVLAPRREPLPTRDQAKRLGVVAVGVVLGFPLFSALALRSLPASHAAVIVGILPAATAVAAVALAGERPSRAFWAASAAGLVAALVFAASQGAGLPRGGDLLALLAVALCSLGYAEGGVLSRELGGWRTICWALLLALPITVPAAAIAAWEGGLAAGPDAWLGFAYVSLVSMFLAFFAWYAGLARGGVARIGQVQLAQAPLTLVWSAALLGERVGAGAVLATLAVLASVAVTQRARVGTAPVGRSRVRRESLLASDP